MEAPSIPAYHVALGALGLGSPIARFAAGTAVAGGLIYIAQPGVFFEGGAAKPWTLMTLGQSQNGVSPTAVPWYLVAILFGFGAATFL